MRQDKMSFKFSLMAERENEQLQFDDALCARVKRLREEKGWTAEQMATALGIPPDRYRKYEVRSPIPHWLIPRFAIIADRTVEFILTGKDQRSIKTVKQAVRKRA